MNKVLPLFLCGLYLLCAPTSSSAVSPDIIGELKTIDNNITVNISVTNVTELDNVIKSGIEKEIVFTVELIRVWKFWPDEFIASKKINNIVKYDNLRDQYWGSSFDGVTLTEKKFNDFSSMKDWMFNVRAVSLANAKGLEPANYYIRIVVESRSIEQLPIMGLLTHLVPEVDMTMAKESQHFFVGEIK